MYLSHNHVLPIAVISYILHSLITTLPFTQVIELIFLNNNYLISTSPLNFLFSSVSYYTASPVGKIYVTKNLRPTMQIYYITTLQTV